MFITTHQRKASQLLLRQLGIVIFAVLLVIVSVGTSAAQSTDRDNPTPLNQQCPIETVSKTAALKRAI